MGHSTEGFNCAFYLTMERATCCCPELQYQHERACHLVAICDSKTHTDEMVNIHASVTSVCIFVSFFCIEPHELLGQLTTTLIYPTQVSSFRETM